MMKKMAEQPHRSSAVIALFILFLIVPFSFVIVVLSTIGIDRNISAGNWATPLLDAKDIVVIAERKVCSFVSANQTAVGINGEDGGASTSIGNTSYFVFGDTNTTSGQIENSVATTTDTDAADCFTMNSKSSGGQAVPMLPKTDSECTIWPTDVVNAVGGQIHFFYSPIVPGTCVNFQVSGVSLGRMDPTTLVSTRVIEPFFTSLDSRVPNYKITGAALVKNGNDVYVFWGGETVAAPTKSVTLLSRVAAGDIETRSVYSYWDGGSFQPDPARMVPLWDQGAIASHGMTIRQNPFLGKWTAIYNTGYVSEMVMRTADNVTGPWSPETQLIDCLDHYALGSQGTDYPCYGGKEHPQFQKNNGQTIYVSHSNTVLYQPFMHEVVLGTAVNQFVDGSGNAVYKTDQTVAGFSKEGTAFYASAYLNSQFTAIKDWVNGSEHIYGTSSPGAGFVDSGIAFYASAKPGWGLAPIYRWDAGTRHRYSALDLTSYGYVRGPVAFWAKITQYRVKDLKKFDRLGSIFEIGVKENNNWVSGASITQATFSGLTPSTNYSIVTNTPFLGNRFFGQSIISDASGNLSFNGNLNYVNVLDLGVFANNQSLDTTSNLFTYWVHHAGVVDNPSEIGHQLNPNSRQPSFKSFVLSGTADGSYEGVVCKPDCAGPVVWSGPVQFCDSAITLSPTGTTKCAELSSFSISGLGSSINYDLYYCMPNCADSVIQIVYPRTSDGSGIVKYESAPVSSPVDTDGDGCSDIQEAGADWRKGGQRDPNNPWDFFDVPSPALKTGVTASKNKIISLQDVGAVLAFVGTWDNGPANSAGYDYDSDINGNGVEDGREYDRTPSTDPNQLWRSGPPNGYVSLQDAMVLLSQVVTNCN